MWPMVIARWFPHAVIGLGVVAVFLLVRGHYWQQGYDARDAEAKAEMLEHLEAMHVLSQRIRVIDNTITETVVETKEVVRREIERVPVPAGGLCGPDGLQFFNDTITAVRAGAGAAADAS